MGNGSAPLLFSESDNAVANGAFRSGAVSGAFSRRVPRGSTSHGSTQVDCGSSRLTADTFQRVSHRRSRRRRGEVAGAVHDSVFGHQPVDKAVDRAVDIAVDNFVD
jgi:hypothetical protein